MELKSEAMDWNAFQVLRVNENERKDIYYVECGIGALKKMVNVMRSGRKEKLTQGLKRKVRRILSNLIFFVIETESTDPIQCEGL